MCSRLAARAFSRMAATPLAAKSSASTRRPLRTKWRLSRPWPAPSSSRSRAPAARKRSAAARAAALGSLPKRSARLAMASAQWTRCPLSASSAATRSAVRTRSSVGTPPDPPGTESVRQPRPKSSSDSASGSTSRPSTRMVGEPGKRRCCACSTVSISVSLTLMAKPSSTATVSRRPRTSLRCGQPGAYRISTATACRLPGVVVPSMPPAYANSRPRVDGAELMSDIASIGPAGHNAGPCKGPDRPSPRVVFAPHQADERLAEKVAAHVLGSAAQVELEPAGNDARVVRRPEEIGELEKRVADAQPVVEERLVPPDVATGRETRILQEAPIERLFVEDRPARHVHQGRVRPHPAQLAGADEAGRDPGQRQRDHDDVGRAQHVFEVAQSTDEVDGLRCRALGVDGEHAHAQRPREGRDGPADAAEAEDGARAAAQLAGGHLLVEGAAPQLVLLDEQPLGEGEDHGEHVFGHGLRPAAGVPRDRDTRRLGGA